MKKGTYVERGEFPAPDSKQDTVLYMYRILTIDAIAAAQVKRMKRLQYESKKIRKQIHNTLYNTIDIVL